MKILLIEDDVELAALMAEVFGSEGHDILVAHTGEDGLRQLRSEGPDAAFLDVRLPGMSGIAVLEEIRSTRPDLPVIIITAYATVGEREAAQRLGVTEILEKPYVLKHFSAALARASGPRTDPPSRP